MPPLRSEGDGQLQGGRDVVARRGRSRSPGCADSDSDRTSDSGSEDSTGIADFDSDKLRHMMQQIDRGALYKIMQMCRPGAKRRSRRHGDSGPRKSRRRRSEDRPHHASDGEARPRSGRVAAANEADAEARQQQRRRQRRRRHRHRPLSDEDEAEEAAAREAVGAASPAPAPEIVFRRPASFVPVCTWSHNPLIFVSPVRCSHPSAPPQVAQRLSHVFSCITGTL